MNVARAVSEDPRTGKALRAESGLVDGDIQKYKKGAVHCSGGLVIVVVVCSALPMVAVS